MKKLGCLLLVLVMVFTAAAAVAEEGLIAHYDFEDPENLGRDVSGNGHDLVLKGKGTLLSSADAAEGTAALELDGEAALATEEAADFSDELESFTISFYAKNEGFAGEHSRVISTGYNGIQAGLCFIVGRYFWDNVTHLIFQPIIGDAGGDFWGKMSDMCTLEGVDDYHWYVASFDAETKTITAWIDGELRGSAEFIDPSVACEPFGFAIGASYASWEANVMYGFIGKIDDVRVYNYSIAELTEIFAE